MLMPTFYFSFQSPADEKKLFYPDCMQTQCMYVYSNI